MCDEIVNDLIESIRLALVNEQNILPIIGFDAIPVKDGDKHVPYLDFLAGRIAADKGLDMNQDLSGFDLFNDVSHQLLLKNQFNKRITTLLISDYARAIHHMVDSSYLEKITTIFPFKYFLNLTFTTHLSEAIQHNRTFPKLAVNETSFPFILKNPRRPDDLKKNECGFVATIYNLYGVAYANGNIRFNYYYSDDDMLTFISEFNKRFDVDLKNYKEAIQDSSLLFLGCQYPDWLLRVLINTLAPGFLDSMNSLQTKVFVDFCNDNATIFFLNKHKLQFQKDLQTVPFMQNLYKTLSKNRFALDINRRDDFVFVSYTRDDLEVVQKIICQLSVQMNIWFDRIKLFPGSLIDDDIKIALKNCKLFLPIITENSAKKQPNDYVRQEWTYYNTELKGANKIIPLIDKNLNLGALGVHLNELFPDAAGNVFYIKFNEEGLTGDNISDIKNKM
ncbi:toll/interleukin-1 receptor domain-containing protein [Mucilaginibacter sp.]|uniref:toll/interleukin-1 receptor domain-containing protein n=1 Tax=Mucilaginibacter sp. TaxID=1882438 RepID=UPI0025DD41F1|nr:toll/interleukin-1 receptor domain-containing protein [Mucilaginibacter sp.]